MTKGPSRADLLLAHRRAFAKKMSLGRGRKQEQKRKALVARNIYRATLGLEPVIK